MTTSTIATITPSQLAARMSAYLVVDVRVYCAFKAGHIAGAVHANTARIMTDRLAKGTDTVFGLVTERFRAAFTEAHLAKTIAICDNSPAFSSSGMSPVSTFCAALVKLGCSMSYLEGGYAGFCELFPDQTETVPIVKTPELSPLQFSGIDKKKTTTAYQPRPVTTGPSKIEANLYLGCYADALNQAVLAELGVTHIINVTADLPNVFEGQPGLAYMRIPVNDTFAQRISDYFESALAFIEAAHASGGVVLIHCMAGISRSATITLAYMMTKTRMTCDQALASLLQRRSIVGPNLDFMCALLRLEKQLQRIVD